MRLIFKQSTDIRDYRKIFEGLVKDFGYAYYHTILVWLEYIEIGEKRTDKYWQLWIVENDEEVIGICGLYSLKPHDVSELWLGWLGVIPEYRKLGIGKTILEFLSKEAKSIGCKKILSYVDREGEPLPFYYKMGFSRIGSVSEFLEMRKMEAIDGSDFEHMDDHVIEKLL